MRRQTLSPLMRLFVFVLCALLTGPLGLMPVTPARAEDAALTVVNIAGGSRYETAVLASEEGFPAGAETVVIATGRNWPDALGGSALAGALDGPILLVNTDSVPAAVLGEIARLGATDAIIVGGQTAVGPAVVTTLEDAGLSVERIAGGSRYETADAVALRVIEEMDENFDGTAFVATGGAYADAVAAAPLAAAFGWPLYLAHPTGGLSEDSRAAMAEITTALVLGGELAVSAAVETGLAGDLGNENVERLAGDSRYATAVAIAEHGVAHTSPYMELDWDRVGIATGQGYPDALAGGVLQGKVGSVMLLTRTASLPDETADALTANKAAITTVTYFGGQLAVSQWVREAVAGVLVYAPPADDPPADDPPADGAVSFPDANLEAAVRGALAKSTGDITVGDMEGLTELLASSKYIVDLTGLEYGVNLKTLWLDDNKISDISALAGLTGLEGLSLGSNQISDLTPLSGMTALWGIDLWDNQISDLTPLEGLTGLEVLGLWSNQISDLTTLSGLTGLGYLELSDNQISDLTPLLGLTGLEGLDLGYNGISDLTPLAGLTGLGRLGLWSNRISDLTPLSGLTGLEVLGLGSNQISDIAPLVANAALGDGDYINLQENNLDLTEGSSAMHDIATLQARGVTVTF